MGFGGYHPFPRRFGGNRFDGKPLTQVLHDALNAQRGAAYDTEEGTIVSLENAAHARALAYDGWEVNDRLGMQWDPLRTTDMLERWERIFAIRPLPDATERSRRLVVASRWARFGGITNHARMTTLLEAALGDFFVGVEYISLANAVVHVPDGTYPWGTVAPGAPWTSTVAHFMVLLQKPVGATEAEFYAKAGKVITTLDPILSAFVTFDWYREPASGGIAVSGGPSEGGFFLDDPVNLDNCVFDS